MSIKTLFSVLIAFTVVACNKPKPSLQFYAEKGDVMIEIDSVCLPELAEFPFRLKLTNNSSDKVVLVFDKISNEYKNQVKNLYIKSDQDTFYLGIKIPDNYLIFQPHTSTSFVGYGYFLYGKGHFESFGDIKNALRKGRLEYRCNNKVLQNISFDKMQAEDDTLLVPSKLEVSTDKALIVDRFLPESFEWREKKH